MGIASDPANSSCCPRSPGRLGGRSDAASGASESQRPTAEASDAGYRCNSCNARDTSRPACFRDIASRMVWIFDSLQQLWLVHNLDRRTARLGIGRNPGAVTGFRGKSGRASWPSHR